MAKTKTVVAGPKSPPPCPPNNKYSSIAELYKQYQSKLEGTCIVDPCGEKCHFLPESFPHLVKLEFFDRKVGRWVAAKASAAVKQLQAGTLDESAYRIGDGSRPRTLFWVPDIVANPDSIHPNSRNNGTEVYTKRYNRNGRGAEIKIVLVDRKGRSPGAVFTSFWCDDKYHKKCVKLPAKLP